MRFARPQGQAEIGGKRSQARDPNRPIPQSTLQPLQDEIAAADQEDTDATPLAPPSRSKKIAIVLPTRNPSGIDDLLDSLFRTAATPEWHIYAGIDPGIKATNADLITFVPLPDHLYFRSVVDPNTRLFRPSTRDQLASSARTTPQPLLGTQRRCHRSNSALGRANPRAPARVPGNERL